jgi:chromosome segregation ATPase
MIDTSKLFNAYQGACCAEQTELHLLPCYEQDAWARVAEVASEPIIEQEEQARAFEAEYSDLQARHDGLVDKIDVVNAQLDEAKAEFAEFRQSVLSMLESSPDEFEARAFRILGKIASFNP